MPIMTEAEGGVIARWLKGQARPEELTGPVRAHIGVILQSQELGNCCCAWGSARGGLKGGEWPEFGCYECPIHQHGLGEQPDELCRRHRRARAAQAATLAENAAREAQRAALDAQCPPGWSPPSKAGTGDETVLLSEAGTFVRERMTQDDDTRPIGDPVRQSKFVPCCQEHIPGRICVLPEGHD